MRTRFINIECEFRTIILEIGLKRRDAHSIGGLRAALHREGTSGESSVSITDEY